MKIALALVIGLIVLALVLPVLHLFLAVLVVAGGVILVMAAWKVLFHTPASSTHSGIGGPPATPLR
jgi:small neutral amino acid transporter SnatA (MarC family)